ncbi:MAG: hypothetical protein GVY24_01950 [Planctomycetes bacterium]|jgi:hypothetical protein|nr:hypothetical protein [Planctomycetota bacterium]
MQRWLIATGLVALTAAFGLPLLHGGERRGGERGATQPESVRVAAAEAPDTAARAADEEAAATTTVEAAAPAIKWAPAVEPKPLSDHVTKGLAWLVEQQNDDGGWGQGEESSHMGHGMDEVKDVSNVADTAMATLALIRAGSTPSEGPHKQHILSAIEFVCNQVEAADDTSLWVTDVRGTRVQSKIGQYVDTFLAANLLSEVKDQMPDAAGNQRVFAALEKVLDKIEKNQKDDGGWDNQGWAGGLGGAMGQKALANAKRVGMEVDDEALDKAQEQAQRESKTGEDGRFAASGKSAGIELYSAATSVGGLADASKANQVRRQEAAQQAEAAQEENARLATALPNATEPEERERIEKQIEINETKIAEAGERLADYDKADEDLDAAKEALLKRMDDEQFVAGFGNNGGEEFLSYLQIGEALVVDGGEQFAEWDKKMTRNLNNVQNNDGSWSGHHCITGRTFCTSAALLVLTVDRAPAPIRDAVRGG